MSEVDEGARAGARVSRYPAALDHAARRDGLAGLDMNENPLGTPESAAAALLSHARDLHRYPFGLAEEARDAVAADAGVEPDSVLLVAGVDEATDLLLLHAGHGCDVTPGFTGYRARAQALGVPMTTLRLDEAWAPPPVGDWAGNSGAVLLAQPGNPTGNLFDPGWLDAAIDRAPLLCVDETYIDFAGRPSFVDGVHDARGLCVFRSFSKAFGIAGLRLGALFGPPRLLAEFAARQRFLAVDSVTLAVLTAVVADVGFRTAVVEHVVRWRPHYAAALEHSGLFDRVVETSANFVLGRCAEPQLVGLLRAEGVLVADCAALGLPGWARVSVGTEVDLQRLLAALDVVRCGAAAPAVVGS